SQALGNAIATNRVGHAYLFTGARGVGKTSTARIFAKCLNCVDGPTASPCGKCDMCEGIAAGEDVDVLEIDGASNRGIDEIRQLRQNVNVRPSRARFKIYIIDEVHMLTTPAFNALLKTLEEPPEHVKFIFCTTEADKIPITVLSRCQRFDFAPIETKSILARLEEIANSEGVEADPEALQILARRAAGSMRDSQSLLEQLLSFGGKKIGVEDIHAMLGTAKSSRLAAITTSIIRRDAATALGEVDAAVREGVDLGQFAEQLVGYFRDVMAAHVGCGEDLLLHAGPNERPQLVEFGSQLGIQTLLAIVQILDQSITRMRHSTHTRTLLEISLVRICKLDDLDELPSLIGQVRDGTLPAANVSQSRAGLPAVRATPSAPTRLVADSSGPTAEKKNIELALQVENSAPVASPPPNLTAEFLPAIWKEALAGIEDMTSDFAAKAESIAISGPNRVVVRHRKAYNKEQCERPERKARLEQALSQVAGAKIQVEFELLPELPAVQVVASAPVPSAAQSRLRRFKNAERNLLVRQAIEMFDGEIVNVVEPIRADEVEGSGPADAAPPPA
ncbi:MAG: DNA polymerase III subunit gamma/tau, partial [Planctomycetales bacterium]|nr:DNA polymerase III subunit gamma/tau [Planctomycetales bacterium]